MTHEPFEQMLSGGHPNSLGRTIEAVDTVLADPSRLDDLYQCYFSEDEVVRLRTSNALKRISKEHSDWLIPYIDKFLTEISEIEQASTQWTLANLFETLAKDMSETQLASAKTILKRNLTTWEDWIVLNNTMQTLGEWAKNDGELKAWLLPYLEERQQDARKSVANRAKKLQARLG
ncbi:MAG: hypothetical protein AAF702_17235 [Chloroflexota bacterium]